MAGQLALHDAMPGGSKPEAPPTAPAAFTAAARKES